MINTIANKNIKVNKLQITEINSNLNKSICFVLQIFI